MTSTKGWGLLAGVALVLAVAGKGLGGPPERPLGTLVAFDRQGHAWDVVRDGDHFVARHPRRDETVPPRNFEKAEGYLRVDGRYLAYDLSGKSKDVLAWNGPAEE